MLFTDADWTSDKDNFRSTTRYIFYLGSNSIAWSSKRLKNTSVFFNRKSETEFRAVASTTIEMDRLQSLMIKLGYVSTITPTIL